MTQGNQPFAYLAEHQFVVLNTYRKNGIAVPTTIWFANGPDGNVYFTTQVQAGKSKRIRNNPRVELTPSNRVGSLLGLPAVEGSGSELTTAEQREHAYTLLKQKYGAQFDQIANASGGATRTYFIVRP